MSELIKINVINYDSLKIRDLNRIDKANSIFKLIFMDNSIVKRLSENGSVSLLIH